MLQLHDIISSLPSEREPWIFMAMVTAPQWHPPVYIFAFLSIASGSGPSYLEGTYVVESALPLNLKFGKQLYLFISKIIERLTYYAPEETKHQHPSTSSHSIPDLILALHDTSFHTHQFHRHCRTYVPCSLAQIRSPSSCPHPSRQ